MLIFYNPYDSFNLIGDTPMQAVTTIKADEARIKMRDILDATIAGDEVVIERYNKPTAVVVNYAHWQAWKKQRASMLRQLSQEIDAGDGVPIGEVIAGMKARGLID
jgi:prevent-host-death family protein